MLHTEKSRFYYEILFFNLIAAQKTRTRSKPKLDPAAVCGALPAHAGSIIEKPKLFYFLQFLMIFCIVKKNSMACSIMKYNRSFNDYH